MNGGDRNLVTVHVSAETLRHKEAGCCEIEDGPSIAAETARRLACDASVVAIVENQDGEPLNVGRKTRTISSPLRRFLNARDRGCRFPGCTNTRWVDAHHIHHWANGGETKPSNLVSLCRFHHRMVHEGGVVIHVLDDGAIRFTQPNGQSFNSVAPDHVHPFDWTQLPIEHEERGIHINERTAATRWAVSRWTMGWRSKCSWISRGEHEVMRWQGLRPLNTRRSGRNVRDHHARMKVIGGPLLSTHPPAP